MRDYAGGAIMWYYNITIGVATKLVTNARCSK